MRKQLLLALLIVVSKILAAQTGNRDSIIQLLRNDKEDTSRVLHLADLSFEYLELKPDTTMTLALEALSLSRKNGFEKGEAVSLNRVGNAYHVLGNYPKSMEVLLQALKINERINNADGIQRNWGNIGLLYSDQEDYRVALDYFFRQKEIAERNNYGKSISIVLSNIGEAYYHLKNYDSAKVFTQLANNAARQILYFPIIGNSYRIMGDINLETDQNILALEYYRLGISYQQTSEQYQSLSNTFLSLAKAFEKLKQKDSALYYATQSLRFAKEKGFTPQVRNAARFLSIFYRKLNDDSAFFYQDISKAANDSIFSHQKQRQLQSLSFDEKLRQQEIEVKKIKDEEERRHDLQDAIIVVGLITFVILFLLLSRSIIVKAKFIEFFGILGLLAVFEFINLFIHPYLSRITSDSHFLMLGVLIAIGALLIPLHHKLEKWITKIMVEKNKKIRLEAAKKTIQQLEG